ncbi:MAG: hypothetical protein ABW004_05070 [Aeromicrobium sp.]
MKKPLLAVAALLLVAACGSGSDPSDGPTTSSGAAAAVETLVATLEDGDCPGVKAIVVTPATVDCDLVESLAGSFSEEGIDLDAVTYEAGPVEGGSSTVTIGWGPDEADEEWQAERVDDTWKVLFDSAV